MILKKCLLSAALIIASTSSYANKCVVKHNNRYCVGDSVKTPYNKSNKYGTIAKLQKRFAKIRYSGKDTLRLTRLDKIVTKIDDGTCMSSKGNSFCTGDTVLYKKSIGTINYIYKDGETSVKLPYKSSRGNYSSRYVNVSELAHRETVNCLEGLCVGDKTVRASGEDYNFAGIWKITTVGEVFYTNGYNDPRRSQDLRVGNVGDFLLATDQKCLEGVCLDDISFKFSSYSRNRSFGGVRVNGVIDKIFEKGLIRLRFIDYNGEMSYKFDYIENIDLFKFIESSSTVNGCFKGRLSSLLVPESFSTAKKELYNFIRKKKAIVSRTGNIYAFHFNLNRQSVAVQMDNALEVESCEAN